MGAWRVEQHYGVGAANVRLCAEPYQHPERPYTLLEGLAHVRADLHAEGTSLRRSFALLPGMAMVVLILASFAVTVARERLDDPVIEVVMLSTPSASREAPAPLIVSGWTVVSIEPWLSISAVIVRPPPARLPTMERIVPVPALTRVPLVIVNVAGATEPLTFEISRSPLFVNPFATTRLPS